MLPDSLEIKPENNTLIAIKLKNAKKKLMELWDIKNMTDQEVLEASIEVDKLLNEYNRKNSNLKLRRKR